MNEDEKTTKDLLRQIKGLELKIIDLEKNG